jgi:hypothetical protein
MWLRRKRRGNLVGCTNYHGPPTPAFNTKAGGRTAYAVAPRCLMEPPLQDTTTVCGATKASNSKAF